MNLKFFTIVFFVTLAAIIVVCSQGAAYEHSRVFSVEEHEHLGRIFISTLSALLLVMAIAAAPLLAWLVTNGAIKMNNPANSAVGYIANNQQKIIRWFSYFAWTVYLVGSLLAWPVFSKTFSGGQQMTVNPQTVELKAGQVWNYHTRPQDASSTFTILKIDADPKLENIFHIAVDNVLSADEHGQQKLITVHHMPVAESAIRKSITTLVRTNSVGLPPEGYFIWKEAFEKNEAGVFTITVAECLNASEEIRRKGKVTKLEG